MKLVWQVIFSVQQILVYSCIQTKRKLPIVFCGIVVLKKDHKIYLNNCDGILGCQPRFLPISYPDSLLFKYLNTL